MSGIDATADSKGPYKFENARKYPARKTSAKHVAYKYDPSDLSSNPQNTTRSSSSSISLKRKQPLNMDPDTDAMDTDDRTTIKEPSSESDGASSTLFPLPLFASRLSLTSRQRCSNVCLRLLDLIQPNIAVEMGNVADEVSGRDVKEEGGTAMYVDNVSDPTHEAPSTTTETPEINTATVEQQLADADRRRAGLAQVCTQFLAHLTRDHLVAEHFQANRGAKRLLTTVSRFDGMCTLLYTILQHFTSCPLSFYFLSHCTF